ncbi:MAG: hypothetical protein J7M40_01365 [Planctomycetes bacterium]|nr:hypothetical protein [Planctomycetota bacterium]
MAEPTEEGFLPTFMKHVVAISLLDAKKGLEGDDLSCSDYDPRHILFSSFVVSVQKIWFLITAGHILKNIDTRIQSGRRIVKARIIDSFQDKQDFTSLPFDFDGAPKVPIYSSVDGVDYGAILLEPFYVRALFAGGTRAFDEKEYEDCPDEADKYFLLGFPTEARNIDHKYDESGGNVGIDIGCPLIPIQRIDKPPSALQSGERRFYAKVPVIEGNRCAENGTMTDIAGMSGGPIIAVKKNRSGIIRYWIVAVQSGWLRSERVLAACYLEPFINALAKAVERLKP